MNDVADEIHVNALLKSLARVGDSADALQKSAADVSTAAPPSPSVLSPGAGGVSK